MRIHSLILMCVFLIQLKNKSYSQEYDNTELSIEQPVVLNRRALANHMKPYDSLALRLNIAGRTIFKLHISKEGKVIDYKLVAYPLPILSAKIAEGFSLINFIPAKKEGIPIDTWIVYPYRTDIFGGGWGPDGGYRNGLRLQAIGQYDTAFTYYSHSIEKGTHLFQLHAVMQRAVCSYILGNYEMATKDLEWTLGKKEYFVELWREKLEVDLIEHPYVLWLERKSFEELELVPQQPANLLIKSVKDAFSL